MKVSRWLARRGGGEAHRKLETALNQSLEEASPISLVNFIFPNGMRNSVVATRSRETFARGNGPSNNYGEVPSELRGRGGGAGGGVNSRR